MSTWLHARYMMPVCARSLLPGLERGEHCLLLERARSAKTCVVGVACVADREETSAWGYTMQKCACSLLSGCARGARMVGLNLRGRSRVLSVIERTSTLAPLRVTRGYAVLKNLRGRHCVLLVRHCMVTL